MSKARARREFTAWLRGVQDNGVRFNTATIFDKGFFKESFSATGYSGFSRQRRPVILKDLSLLSELKERNFNIYKDFPLKFTSLEVFPDEIRKIPDQAKEELENFWATLIANSDLIDQLFTILQSLHSDANNLIPQLQDIVEEIKDQFSDLLPEDKLNNLEAAVQEINIPHVQPSMEEIFTAIEKAEVETLENRGNVSIFSLIQPLNEEAKNWLGKLFMHLIQNPDLETDVYDSLYAMNDLLLHYKSMSNSQSDV